MNVPPAAIGNYQLCEIVEQVDDQKCFRAAHQKLGRNCLVTLTQSTPSRNADAAERYIAIAKKFQSNSFHAFPRAYTAGLQDDVAFLTSELVSGMDLDQYLQDRERCSPSQVFQLLGQLLICGQEIERLGFSTDNVRLDDFIVDCGVVRLWRIHELRVSKPPPTLFMPRIAWNQLIDRVVNRDVALQSKRAFRNPRWVHSISRSPQRSITRAIRWFANASQISSIGESNQIEDEEQSTAFQSSLSPDSNEYLKSYACRSRKIRIGKIVPMALFAVALAAGIVSLMPEPDDRDRNARSIDSMLDPPSDQPVTTDLLDCIDPTRDTFRLHWTSEDGVAHVEVDELKGIVQFPIQPAMDCKLTTDIALEDGGFEVGFSVGDQRLMAAFVSNPERHEASLWSYDEFGRKRTLDTIALARSDSQSTIKLELTINGPRVRIVLLGNANDETGSNNTAALQFSSSKYEQFSLRDEDSFYSCRFFMRFAMGEYIVHDLEVTTTGEAIQLFEGDNSNMELARRAIWRGAQINDFGPSGEEDPKTLSRLEEIPQTVNITMLSAKPGRTRCGLSDQDLDWIAQIKSLKKLDLSGTQITEKGLARLDELDELQMLVLDGQLAGIASIAAIEPGENLRSLSLRNFRVHGSDAVCFRSLGQLTYLCLSGCDVDGELGRQIRPFLPNLQHLCFIASNFPPRGLTGISTWESLRELQLAGTEVGDGDVQVIAEMPWLTMVDLESTNVTSSGIELLRQELPSLEIKY